MQNARVESANYTPQYQASRDLSVSPLQKHKINSAYKHSGNGSGKTLSTDAMSVGRNSRIKIAGDKDSAGIAKLDKEYTKMMRILELEKERA